MVMNEIGFITTSGNCFLENRNVSRKSEYNFKMKDRFRTLTKQDENAEEFSNKITRDGQQHHNFNYQKKNFKHIRNKSTNEEK